MKRRLIVSLCALFLVSGCGGGLQAVNSDAGNSSNGTTGGGGPLLPPGKATGEVAHQVVLGDRHFIRDVLTQVFVSGSGAASDTAVKNLIQTLVMDNGHIFGGSCLDYDPEECQKNKYVDHQGLSALPSNSAPRSASMLNVCSRILETSGVVAVVEQKAGTVGMTDLDSANFDRLHALFYPAASPSAETYASFLKLFNKAKASDSRDNAVKLVVYGLCTSPDWSAL